MSIHHDIHFIIIKIFLCRNHRPHPAKLFCRRSIGHNIVVTSNPKMIFRKINGTTVSMTLSLRFEVDPNLLNVSDVDIPIDAEMGDLFVAQLDTELAIDDPDDMYFSFNNTDTKYNLGITTGVILKAITTLLLEKMHQKAKPI